MLGRLLWKPGVTLVIGLLVGLVFGLFAAKNSDFGSLYGTAVYPTFQGYVYDEGVLPTPIPVSSAQTGTNRPIQGARVEITVEGFDLKKGVGWVRTFKAITDANGFWNCEINMSRADSWTISVTLPEGDTRTFSRVEAPGSPNLSGQIVHYQSLEGLPNPAEIKFYFK
jgi:hypothetical protein